MTVPATIGRPRRPEVPVLQTLSMLLFGAATACAAAASFDRALVREAQADASYVLLDARTRETLASRWPDADRAIPLASLVKPFLALAGIEGGVVPARFDCHGEVDRCWLPSGHGSLTLAGAIAHSCNASFLRLGARVRQTDLDRVCARYGLPLPGDESSDTRIGLGGNWKISPLAITSAYLELNTRRSDAGVATILDGLRRSAREGTARGLGFAALAKTGTGPCSNLQGKHAGDGFTVALFPPDSPRYLLLVRVHGVPGAASAKTAARLAKIVLHESK